MAIGGPGFGEALFKNTMAQKQSEVQDMELELKRGELGFKMADMQERRAMAKQTMIQKNFQESVQGMRTFAEAVKELGPNFKAGSPLDKAIDTQKGLIAKWAEHAGEDPNIGHGLAEAARSLSMRQAPDPLTAKVKALQALGVDVTPEMATRMAGAAETQSDSRFSPGGPLEKDGEYIGDTVFDRKTGTMQMLGPDGKQVPIPAGVKPTTDSALSRNVMTGDQFKKLADEVQDTETAVNALDRYFSKVKNTEQGWRLLADQFIGQMNTVLGKNVDQKQFDTLVQSGQLQGLLGRFRKEVVGGGVMTEQDALRVLSALGGDISALRNKEVVAELMKDLLSDKARDYDQRLLPIYKTQVKGRGPGFPEKQPLGPRVEKIFAKPEAKPESAGGTSVEELLKLYGGE